MTNADLRGPAFLTPVANLWKRMSPRLVPVMAVVTALIMTIPFLFLSSTIRKAVSGKSPDLGHELSAAWNTSTITYNALLEGALGLALNDLASSDDLTMMQSFAQKDKLTQNDLRTLSNALSAASDAGVDDVRRYVALLAKYPDLTDDQLNDFKDRIPAMQSVGLVRLEALRPLIADLGKLERKVTTDLGNRYAVMATLSPADRADLETQVPAAKGYSDADLLADMKLLKDNGIVKLQHHLDALDTLKGMGIDLESQGAQDLVAIATLQPQTVRDMGAALKRLDEAGVTDVDELLYEVRLTGDLYAAGIFTKPDIAEAISTELDPASTTNLIVRRPSSVERLLVYPSSAANGIIYSNNNTPNDPSDDYPDSAYFRLGSKALLFFPKELETMLVRAVPFIIVGLAIGLGFKAGLFNIGAEGQLYAGSILAVVVGFTAPFANLPWFIHVPLVIVAGIIGGMLWGAIPGALKAYTGAHEVINTIMLNFVAIHLVDWLIKSTNPLILLDPAASTPRTPYIVDSAKLPRFNDIPNWLLILAGIVVAGWMLWHQRERLQKDWRWAIRPVIYGGLVAVGGLFLSWITVSKALNIGLLLMVCAVWFTDWYLNRTTLGFELRTVGANPDAARYAGMNVKWNIVLAMILSGALAGLAGTIEISGKQFNMQPDFFSGLGFDAIAVALLARSNPRSMIWAGLLWGSLLTGAGLMQVRANISIDLVKIIQALIIMFVAADAIIRYLWRVPKATAEEKAAATFSKGWGG